MDPTACLRRIMEALDAGIGDEVREAGGDLLGWLRGGGFPPEASRDQWIGLAYLLATWYSVSVDDVRRDRELLKIPQDELRTTAGGFFGESARIQNRRREAAKKGGE